MNEMHAASQQLGSVKLRK